ncbi:hypothetical protein [Massilia sp. ZL223]|uniref:hypothetical protein n=1 Tax=Massilia sp. ZL223 TaxID=2824904 RepID=UPI001B83B6F0|nr:hypothetical protein [Massilia sp. ZL223]MBQ5963173.1 hypothetical protein [Massilia sp. ZL223]
MFSVVLWVAFIAMGIYVLRLESRLKKLNSRVEFLEDRSPQANHIRELEDYEKGWKV